MKSEHEYRIICRLLQLSKTDTNVVLTTQSQVIRHVPRLQGRNEGTAGNFEEDGLLLATKEIARNV
jgi:hypothetical protein